MPDWIVPFKVSKEELYTRILEWLVQKDDTPADILRGAIFEAVERAFIPVYHYSVRYTGNYTATVKYVIETQKVYIPGATHLEPNFRFGGQSDGAASQHYLPEKPYITVRDRGHYETRYKYDSYRVSGEGQGELEVEEDAIAFSHCVSNPVLNSLIFNFKEGINGIDRSTCRNVGKALRFDGQPILGVWLGLFDVPPEETYDRCPKKIYENEIRDRMMRKALREQAALLKSKNKLLEPNSTLIDDFDSSTILERRASKLYVPLWILRYTYGGKPYQITIDGYDAERSPAGERPVDSGGIEKIRQFKKSHPRIWILRIAVFLLPYLTLWGVLLLLVENPDPRRIMSFVVMVAFVTGVPYGLVIVRCVDKWLKIKFGIPSLKARRTAREESLREFTANKYRLVGF